MNWLLWQLDSTPKRVFAALLVSGGIVFAVSSFAQTSYLQTQKLQIESDAGRHCEQWSYRDTGSETLASCERFGR